MYEVKGEKIKGFVEILNKIIKSNLSDNQHRYDILLNKLDLLNPLNILSKGYSVVTVGNDVVKSSKKVKVNDEVHVRLHEGKIKAVVKEIE
jgi:exodeoxyribonuclease VII large subunit